MRALRLVRLAFLAAAAALTVPAARVGAQTELLTDPGFSSGLASYTTAASANFTVEPVIGDCTGLATGFSGGCVGVRLNDTGAGFGRFGQTVATTVGQRYTAAITARTGFPIGGFLTVLVGGTTFNFACAQNVACLAQATFVATAPTTAVAFGFERSGTGGTGSIQFDNASVASTVPEPSTYALLASGLLALGTVAHRRRRAAR